MPDAVVDKYIEKCQVLWNTPRTRDNLWRITSGTEQLLKDWEKMSVEQRQQAQAITTTEFSKQKKWPFQKKIKGEGIHGDVIMENHSPNAQIVDSDGQALQFRVGMVFNSKGKAKQDGLWIEYQRSYSGSDLMGPVLMSEETWREVSKTINAAFRKNRKVPSKR